MMDAVFCWVDGSDSAHQREKARWLEREGLASSSVGNHHFRSSDELRFALRSIERFAPWIERVFVVTSCGQRPPFLSADGERVRVVQDVDIFPDKTHVPCFNSAAIERHVHRIPGLRQPFLYLNDDMLFADVVEPEFFIRFDGRIQCHVVDVLVPELEAVGVDSPRFLFHRIPRLKESTWGKSLMFTNALLSERFGQKSRPLPPHGPMVVDARVCEDFERLWPEASLRTSASRFRRGDNLQFQFAYTHFLLGECRRRTASGLPLGAYSCDEVVAAAPEQGLSAGDFALVVLGSDGGVPDLRRAFSERRKVVCVQDSAEATVAQFDEMRLFLEQQFPCKSSFEK